MLCIEELLAWGLARVLGSHSTRLGQSLKILFLNVYYEDFMQTHYEKNDIAHLSYLEQWESIQGAMHSDADFYSRGMSKQGWQAHDLITNCKALQRQWARENDFTGDKHLIWVEQIRRYKPDVVYVQGLWLINDETYPLIKDHCKLIVGQVASPASFAVKNFDCIFSSMPHFVERFREHGTVAHCISLAFDARANADLDRIYDVTFVGGITNMHTGRIEFLRELSKKVDIDCWGYGFDQLKDTRLRYHGVVWGREMFNILSQSYITLNYHIDCAEDYANNMRLYESTGCGTLLITDWKKNLGDLFSHDEVVAFGDVNGALKAINYYLNHREEGSAIAKRGQKRTLKEHTYDNRMAEIATILESML